MNHRPLESGSSELVKTHNGYGRDKTRRINEIAQVTRDFVESRRLFKKMSCHKRTRFINP